MNTLQAKLEKLGFTKSAPSRRTKKEQPQDVKHWQSAYDWSEVEAELLESQARDAGSEQRAQSPG